MLILPVGNERNFVSNLFPQPVSDDISDDMLNFRNIGEKDMFSYINSFSVESVKLYFHEIKKPKNVHKEVSQ